MKLTCTLKYKRKKYNISFRKFIKVKLLIGKLFLRRILRFFKRIAIEIRSYYLFILLIIIFEAFTIPIGLCLGKYNSWIDGFWDLRLFILTSVLISIGGGIVNTEIKRHQELQRQSYAYQEFKYDSNVFIERLCFVFDLDVSSIDIFLNEKKFQEFREKLKLAESNITENISNNMITKEHFLYTTKTVSRAVFLSITLKEYICSIERLNSYLSKYNAIGSIQHCFHQIDWIYKGIMAEYTLMEDVPAKYTDFQLLKFVDVITRTIIPAIGDIRRPWRWDVKDDDLIKSILSNH